MEEVKSLKYLGYTLMANGGQEAHVEDRVKEAAAVKGKVWGIGNEEVWEGLGEKGMAL